MITDLTNAPPLKEVAESRAQEKCYVVTVTS